MSTSVQGRAANMTSRGHEPPNYGKNSNKSAISRVNI